MPVCCRCNGRGCCISCACVKFGSRYLDCLPSRSGHCANQELSSDGVCEQEGSRILSPLLVSPSDIIVDGSVPGVGVEGGHDGSSDSVVMLNDVDTVPLSPGFSSEFEVFHSFIHNNFTEMHIYTDKFDDNDCKIGITNEH